MQQPEATLLAAVLAATLSAASLLVSIGVELVRTRAARNQETVKWVRSELHEVALGYLTAAFKMSHLSSNGRQMIAEGAPTAEVQAVLDEVRELHADLTDKLTALRLLAPPDLLASALAVHDTSHEVVNAAFDQAAPADQATWFAVKAKAHEARLELVNAARRPLGLPPAVKGDGGYAASNWSLPPAAADPIAEHPADSDPHQGR